MCNHKRDDMMICLPVEPFRTSLETAMKCIKDAMQTLDPHLGPLKSRGGSVRRAIQDAHNEVDVAREVLKPYLEAVQRNRPSPAREVADSTAESGTVH